MGPIQPSWGIMIKTTATRISNQVLLFMSVTILAYDFGTVEELIVLYLTKMNSKDSGEFLVVCGCSGYLWMSDQRKNVFRNIVFSFLE